MVVMHGRDIHKYYETPEGVIRFALTCRYIRPETIRDESRRVVAINNGTVPEHWKENQYEGADEAIEPEISEDPSELEQPDDTYNVLGDADDIAGEYNPPGGHGSQPHPLPSVDLLYGDSVNRETRSIALWKPICRQRRGEDSRESVGIAARSGLREQVP
ncbi:hypothetical protein F5X99DRAFT_409597 [Biscogniauxia marginata]|nr:hypothetical protein F5X99DRAFT_409597 [Biscogniauxia marginata]